MRPKTSRLLLVLVSTMLGACAGQTERSSTGGGPKTVASEPVSYVDPPRRGTEPATAPPEPAAAPKAAPPPAEEPAADIRAEGEPADMAPVPSPDSFEPDADDHKISDPVMAYDEEEGTAQEETIVGQNQYYDEEDLPTKDDGIVSQNQYSEEEEGKAPEEGIVAESQYYDEEDSAAATDDGIVAQHQYFDEESVETDDGIVARSQYYDEESIETDDGIVSRNEFYDEETVEADDGVVASRQYYDEEDVVENDDGIVARNEFFEEEDRESPELIGEPKSYPEETVVAAAEEKQPVPAPKQEAPKPVVLPVTVTLQSETLFAFDRYAVQSETRAALDKLASGLQGVQYDAVVIVGHADRIGTKAYNQQLSLRRAEAVKQYLISKGVAANTIKTEGRGELDPALDPSACQGKRKQQLIACLQPDRRVDVTVTGQKRPK